MARAGLTPTYLSELSAGLIRPTFLFEAEFASQPLRLWTGIGDLVWNSQIYYGNGWLQGWSGPGESDEVKAIGMTITLAGVPPAIVSLALGESRQNKPGRLYLAFLDSALEVKADPYLLFLGKLDTVDIRDSIDGATVTLSYENEWVEIEKAEELRINDATQKNLYPGDRGLEYVQSLADWSGYWGVPETKDKKKKRDRKPRNRKRRK